MTNLADYALSLPALLLALFAIGCLVMDWMFPPEWRWLNAVTALIGIAFGIAGVVKVQLTQAQLEHSGIRLQVGFQHAMVVDELTIYFYYLLLVGALLAVLISLGRSASEMAPRGDFYAGLLCAVIGLMAAVSGFNLWFIFAGIVVSEAAGCWMVRSLTQEDPARSAWLRFVLWRIFSVAILGSGFLLLGLSAGAAGLHEIRQAAARLAGGELLTHREFRIGLALTVAGVILRVGALPFHQWNRNGRDGEVPNVGAQNCVLGLLSAAYPAAAWAMALHIFLWGLYPAREIYAPWLIWVALALVGVGILAMLLQTDLRRLVAYSSLPAAGYMLAALAAVASGDPMGTALTSGLRGILVYIPGLILMNIGALAALALQSQQGIGGEIGDLQGLAYRAPLQAELLLISFLSIVGIPPLAGFYGKYYAYMSVVGAGHGRIAALGIGLAVLGVWCVARIGKKLFTHNANSEPKLGIELSGVWIALILCAGATVVVGVHPQFLIHLADWAGHLN